MSPHPHPVEGGAKPATLGIDVTGKGRTRGSRVRTGLCQLLHRRSADTRLYD